MGVFDFVKEAGAKIGIGDSKEEQEEKAAEAKAASEERAAEVAKRVKDRRDAAARAERIEKLEESKKARGLEGYIRKLGLDISGLDIRFDDGVATVSGTAADQETRERVILAIGNTAEVGQVHDEIEVPADAKAESTMHVVVKGDTLSAIAKEYLGDATEYPVIFEANRPMLSDPDKIYVGQVLRIPGD
ncbi:MAG: peptidoglycan-binding protein LysM [Actinomycetia bacterium]|nr:peptidoglycan-binding protein LysM [Actinomycetes bacterium]MCP4226779.1 peptidoglycan-binding protein LysM [Actinomycetes bacterium]MCP5030163.1 peptidoglycan-binding protein LysM [Actinomycetes bacterium]